MSAVNRYFENLSALLSRTLETQQENMERAAQAIADCLRSGHMVYTLGTGHGHLLALEVFYRAGGMARVCPVLDERLMLHISAAESTRWERREEITALLLEKYPIGAGDVLIAASNSGRNGAAVLYPQEARRRGATVIALTSMRHSQSVTPRNSAGLRLYETADIVLDNGGVPGDAALEMADGMAVGPTSTAVGAAMLQAIACRVKEISLEEGWEAEFFKSSNIDGGDEYNEKLLKKYGKQIPGLV
ncbi:MAG: SIS domain-containing protein [Clostridiales bacterium]|nr:SIS domain-containing protein [Clostridiales bacterium]